MSVRRALLVLSLIAVLTPLLASAGSITMVGFVCSIVKPIYDTLKVVGPTLVLIMFVYGATKYAYSADDPGGRKQGKDICVHSIVAGLLLMLSYTVMSILGLITKISSCGIAAADILGK
jgi:hypothetical protein